MKPHVINAQKNFISGWYIDKNLCDSIVEACAGQNKLKFNGETKDTTRGYICAFLKSLSNNLYEKYILEVNKALNLYYEEYPFLKNCASIDYEKMPNSNLDAVQIQIYSPLDYYSALHCENPGPSKQLPRCLAYMTYLNDIEDQGGTYFPYQNYTSKPEKGLTLIWPAYWTHPHKGVVAPTEKKFIATGWFNFLPDAS